MKYICLKSVANASMYLEVKVMIKGDFSSKPSLKILSTEPIHTATEKKQQQQYQAFCFIAFIG